ncbi:hypothetical protein ARMSODRAFT_982793 [Armillaria solidipes]|uniref:DUF6533 domain-containing protein n=1 Tax=Armillaria solidipes TaxID=1076256 RepID=A0A2H3APX3_9AGAR|nr:hypothetical protein ARMSODRAFT_982793 [Armillaria solidipes]
MSTASIPVNRILFVTYTPAAAMVLMLWDHCLTFNEEVATMWSPLDEGILTKVVHILNRYFTEAVLLYRVYITSELAQSASGEAHCKAVVWLANVSAVIIASISQFYIMMRVYCLWDHRQWVRRTLLVAFGICITTLTVLSILSVLSYLKTGGNSDSQNTCAIGRIPTTVACTIGVLLFFNVFVIFMTIYNALEKPRRSENELLDSLRRDGARVYLGICSTQQLPPFRINLTITCSAMANTSGVFCHNRGDLISFSINLSLVCSLNANITARVHLRIEGLRRLFPMRPVTIYRGSVEN